jgi:hypothetical protein
VFWKDSIPTGMSTNSAELEMIPSCLSTVDLINRRGYLASWHNPAQ